MSGVEIVLAAGAELAEGAVWDDRAGVLWWIDIFVGSVHRLDPASGSDRSWRLPGSVGSLALCEDGDLVVSLRDGFYRFSPASGGLAPLARPEPDRPHNRFNDGRTDRQGRFWAGSLHDRESEPTGALWRLDADRSCHRLADGIYASNGTAFSPDGRTGYHADSRTGMVWRFDIDPDDGAIFNRAPFLRLERREGAPDGATVDADGCYWLTHAGGWRIGRYTPSGAVDRIVPTPVEIPTCLAFGGSDGRTLFITTARYGLSAEALAMQPLAGHILALDTGCSGPPDARFRG